MIISKNKLRENKKGQVLLIAVMLLTTIITVVMTIAFNSTSETQVAQLEADSQKALAAAEAGIDAVIKQTAADDPIDISGLGGFGEQKISGSAQVLDVLKPTFISPLMQKDQQYTFYLSDVNLSIPWTGSFNLYLVSEEGQCPSVEISIVNNIYEQERYAYNTCSLDLINNAAVINEGEANVIDGVSFDYKTSTPIMVTNGLVAFIKVVGGRTKIGFQSADTNISLPLQGKTVESEARTATGVVKKVELFQSYPQMPSNFFMTSF